MRQIRFFEKTMLTDIFCRETEEESKSVDLSRKKCYNRDMETQERTAASAEAEVCAAATEFAEKENQKTEKEKLSLGKRIAAFFDKHYALIFAPLLVMALYLSALANMGVYPFGDKYTAASYDLSAQICPFIEHLFDVVQGKSALTYSYAIVGGADVTGTFLYFFISPFSFLFLIFGDGMVAHASSIVMLCKLMAVAFAGTWFAKTLFKHIPDYIAVAIGVVYTYCGYMFVANTYINWVDFLIYMPFCVWGFRHFVQTERFVPFAALMACCIYTCFSIACFAMFTVFPALIAYGLLCVEKEKRHRFIARLCMAFVVAILLALPILLPALAAFTRSARGGGLFENFWYGFKNVSEETGLPSDFDSSKFLDTWSSSLYSKWSYIFSDSVFVVLTVIWFIRRGLKDKFAQFMLVAGILTLLPTIVDESMNLLNMGSYMSYALRFGFLNAIYFLGGACLAVDGWHYEKYDVAFDGTKLLRPLYEKASAEKAVATDEAENAANSENDKGMVALKMENEDARVYASTSSKRMHNRTVWVISVAFALLAAVAAVLLLIFTNNENYKNFWESLVSDSELIKSIDSFPSRFAHSLGGLEVVIVLFAVVAVVTILGSLAVSLRKISPRLLSIALIAVVGVQVLFYNNQLVAGNASTQHEKVGSYQTLCAELNARDSSYFRVKDYSDSLTSCIPFTGNSNSFSAFSSVIDADNFVCYELFGYKGNGKNNFKSAHNTNKGNRSDEFGDSFLGYKYFFVPTGSKSNAEEKTYLKPVVQLDENGDPVLDEKGNEVQVSDGGYWLYENTIVFPLGYRVDSGEYRFATENIANATNRKINQQALYKFLRGEDLVQFTGSQFVTPTSAKELSEYLWGKAAEVEVGAGTITARVTAEKGESLFLNFVASKGYTVTVNGRKASLVDNDLKFLAVDLDEGENVVVFTYSSPYVKYMALGVVGGLVGLCAVAFVLKKTHLLDICAPVVSWAGITLAAAVTAFFMLFPTCAFIVKLFLL